MTLRELKLEVLKLPVRERDELHRWIADHRPSAGLENGIVNKMAKRILELTGYWCMVKDRHQPLPLYRNIIMLVLWDMGYGYTSIGRGMGCNHATVWSGLQTIRNEMEYSRDEYNTKEIYRILTKEFRKK